MTQINGIVLLAGLAATGVEAERIDATMMMAGLDSAGVPRLLVLEDDGTIGGGASLLSELEDTDITSPGDGTFLQYNAASGKWIDSASAPGSGTVTSVGLITPSILSVSGSPITTSGSITLTLATQIQKTFLAGPTSGADASPTFRVLAAADLPAGTGTVTSVAMTVPAILAIGGSPVTTTGTLALTLATQVTKTFFSGPASGADAAPTFRVIAKEDLPGTLLATIFPGITLASTTSPITLNASVGTSGQVLTSAGAGATPTWTTPTTGTVTSIAATVPSILSVSGSPITGAGTLAVTLATQTANLHFIGPTSGGAAVPTFRALVALDLASGGAAGNFLRGDMTWSSVFGGAYTVSADNTHDLAASGATFKDIYAARFMLRTRQDYTVTNLTTDRSFDANATSIDELADVVGSLITDLITAGLIQ